ncbi:odorant receptor Or2-like [Fopius arisanus]|uniref:Odorant receptor n=1 Tax=Fopius arisanus TaxID=64838 RepID=A0A9R1T3C1_9HYME|nr:PREDICTED: odorant receptor Or2-like [Fopius arisanus]
MTYSGITMLTILIITIKFYAALVNRTWYENLLRLAPQALWGDVETDYDKGVMKKCEKQAMIFVCAFASLAGSSGCLYISEPIIFNILNNITIPKDRTLIFKIWQDWPVYETPNYEIIFFIQALITTHLCVLYSCFESFLVLINTFITGHFTILKNRMEFLYSHQIITRMRRNSVEEAEKDSLADVSREFRSCIRKHQFLIEVIDQVEGLYAIMNLASVMVHSIIICLCGYQTIMPGNPILRRIKFGIYVTGCLSQLFFFAFTCNNLTLGSMSVSDGPYNSSWYSGQSSQKGRSLTKDYVIMIMRAQRPCRLTGAGFFDITLDTVKSVITTAFSYLTLIRQSAS